VVLLVLGDKLLSEVVVFEAFAAVPVVLGVGQRPRRVVEVPVAEGGAGASDGLRQDLEDDVLLRGPPIRRVVGLARRAPGPLLPLFTRVRGMGFLGTWLRAVPPMQGGGVVKLLGSTHVLLGD
jgi:hypothetical protein